MLHQLQNSIPRMLSRLVPVLSLLIVGWPLNSYGFSEEVYSTSLPPLPDGKKWVYVWGDEFSGNDIDTTKWVIQGDGPRKDAYWSREDAFLDGQGHLVLRTSKQNGKISSGAISSTNKFEQKFGFFAIRCKFPTQQGHWPAFWLYTPSVMNIDSKGRDGTEIDIMEKPSRANEIQHNLHWDGYGKHHRSSGKKVPISSNSSGFHVFAVFWSPEEYVFYVDGEETWRTKAGGVSQVAQSIWITEEVHAWAGNIKRAKLPDYFLVDWIRAFATSSSK